MKRTIKTGVFLLALAALAFMLTACTSDSFVRVTIENKTNSIVHAIEVDYPAGPPSNGTQTFGKDRMIPDEIYHYKFKSTGDGLLKIRFTNPAGQVREEPGPPIHEGDHGAIKVTLTAAGLDEWVSQLQPKK